MRVRLGLSAIALIRSSRYICGPMEEDKNSPFRFLDDEEFARLSTREKAIYLNEAAQELEARQRRLREQMHALIKDPRKLE